MDDETAAANIQTLCMSGDNETDHSEADRILCELLAQLGYEKTVAAWEAVRKWYA